MTGMPRVFVRGPLQTGHTLALDGESARHVQVLRLQPGMQLVLFNGEGGSYLTQILHMGRQQVDVTVLSFAPDVLTPACRTQLVVGMPANERMDWLVEKATELGVSRITPLITHGVETARRSRPQAPTTLVGYRAIGLCTIGPKSVASDRCACTMGPMVVTT